MKANGFEDGATGQSDPLSSSGILDDVQSLWQELRALSFDRLQLAALETQRAGQSLVFMLIAGIIAACLLSSACLGLLATVVLVMIEHGLPVGSAMLLVVAANLLAALILLVLIRRKSRFLKFPATLNSLKPLPAVNKGLKKS